MTISANPLTAEFVAPLLVAKDKGEFEAENLDVQLEAIPVNDAIPTLASGGLDATWSGPTPGFFNQISQGANLRMIMGNFTPADASKSGLWANKSCGSWAGAEPAVAAIPGKLIGSVAGPTSPTIYPIGEALKAEGASLANVQLQIIPSGADIVTALKDCAVDAAWVLDPFWVSLTSDPNMVFLVGQKPGEPNGGLMAGNSLLSRPDVATALTRALIRTYNTYFAGDYKSSADFLNYVAGLMNTPVDRLQATPSLVFDWEIRKDTTTRMQGYYVEGGTQQGSVLPETQTVDRSFYEAAVGHKS